MYTAYLGGEMVYGRGIGVRSAAGFAQPNGVRRSVPVLSAAAPGMFLRDALAGASWLFKRTTRTLRGQQSVAPSAVTG